MEWFYDDDGDVIDTSTGKICDFMHACTCLYSSTVLLKKCIFVHLNEFFFILNWFGLLSQFDALIECWSLLFVVHLHYFILTFQISAPERNKDMFSVCDVCEPRLKDAASFKQQVLKCERKFQELYLVAVGKLCFYFHSYFHNNYYDILFYQPYLLQMTFL